MQVAIIQINRRIGLTGCAFDMLTERKIVTSVASVSAQSFYVCEEQLQLFAANGSKAPSLNVATHVHQPRSKRERLATLLAGELNFHGEDSSYASHDVHAFAAKFPPQLPRVFIRG